MNQDARGLYTMVGDEVLAIAPGYSFLYQGVITNFHKKLTTVKFLEGPLAGKESRRESKQIIRTHAIG